jgi:hypothetical protein
MKTIVILSCLFFAACNAPYYITVNDMNGQPASITLTNGTQLNGKVSVKILNNYYGAERLLFAEGTAKEYKDYKLSEVKLMYINGATYYVKKIVGNSFNRDVKRFVKEISQPGGRMALYENEVVTKNSSSNIDEIKTGYFIQLPNAADNEIFNVLSTKFTPSFNDKMSSYVQDCPTLAEKIKSKNKDYFYPFMLSDNSIRRKAVLLQIINDYNVCK